MSRRGAIRLAVALAVLVVLVAVADRVSASLAEKAAATYLSKQPEFTKPPTVVIHGVPFLTQAVRGRYNDVEVSSARVQLDSVSATNLDVHLKGMKLSLSDAFGGSIRALPCDSVEGQVTFTYQEIEALSQIPGLSLVDSNGQLAAMASLKIPGVGSVMTVQAVATIQIVSGTVRLQVSKVAVTGQELPASAVAQLSATLSAPIPIPALPFGIKIDAVTSEPDGVVVHGSGSNVVITATG